MSKLQHTLAFLIGMFGATAIGAVVYTLWDDTKIPLWFKVLMTSVTGVLVCVALLAMTIPPQPQEPSDARRER